MDTNQVLVKKKATLYCFRLHYNPPLNIFFICNRTPLRSLWDLFYWSYRKQIPKTGKRSRGGLMRKIDKRLEDKKINFFHYKQEINDKEIYEGR
jgi:hypothetical protein